MQKASVVIGFRSLVQAFTQLGTVVRVCTLPLLGRWAQIRELGSHLYEMFCDTLTTPLVAQVVRGHKMYECKACLHWCCSCVECSCSEHLCGGPWLSTGVSICVLGRQLGLLDFDAC